MDNIPYLYEGGCDFIIKKSDLGGRRKYDVVTNFARLSSDLTENEIAVAEDQMIDLITLLPASPGLEKVETMLEAALTGASYEDEGAGSAPAAAAASAESTPAASAAVSESTPAAEKPAAEYDPEADDILATIRNRKKKTAE